MTFKSIALAATALVLSMNSNAAIIDTTNVFSPTSGYVQEYSTNNSGEFSYAFGLGADTNGSSRKVLSTQGFDSSLGSLVSVRLSYRFIAARSLTVGSYSADSVAGYNAVASHQSTLNYGFDSVFTNQLENTISHTSSAGQNSIYDSSISVAWNRDQVVSGYYVQGGENSRDDYIYNQIEFDNSLFDAFTNKEFQLELQSTTFNSSITGCSDLSTCGMATDTTTQLYSVFLTYTYDDGVSVVPAVPVPAAVWLFGSGLLGLIGVARRNKA